MPPSLLAFDLETHLIQPGLLAPPIVCGSFADKSNHPWLFDPDATLRAVEASLRSALELEPDNEGAIIDLAELLAGEERGPEALELLARIPETPDTRRVAALVRSGGLFTSDEEVEARLNELLEIVKGDDDARQQFIDLLELLGPDDPRTAVFRRKLTTRLF